jgi:hypothetical protein
MTKCPKCGSDGPFDFTYYTTVIGTICDATCDKCVLIFSLPIQSEIDRLAAELAEARKEWQKLALYVAQHFDEECADAEWSDIPDFDPWDCIRKTAAEIAEVKKESARWRSAHVELCAAIAMMPTEVECRRHRTHVVVIDTDSSHRQPLIELFYRQRAAIDTGEGE